MPSVLFVCTGNTCRSPMAEVIFRALLHEQNVWNDTWRVESAGTWAYGGSPAAKNAVVLMARRGLDLYRHRSRTVDAAMLAQFQLILVMEANHKEALLIEFPELDGRVFMLSEMVGQKVSVADPVTKDISFYEACANEMESYMVLGWQRILELAGAILA
jgi:protein-tyrosine-phosphatase